MRNPLYKRDKYNFVGCEKAYLRVLKQLDDIITKLTPNVFESSWKSEEIPCIVKITIISPIYEKGGKEDPVNCKSFSIVSGENNAARGSYF